MGYFVPRTASDLDDLVARRIEENTFLEFKSQRAIADGNFRRELPRDVSAFANAGGGVLIVGIEEDGDGCADKVQGDKSGKVDASWFENILLAHVRPRLPDIEILRIEHASGIVFAIHVPQSMAAPHQCSDHRFYARRQRRRDPLDWFELDLLKLRQQAVDYGVFGGLVIKEGLLWAVVENKRTSPIFEVQLEIPAAPLAGFEHRPKLCEAGLSVVGARSELKYFVGSVVTLLAVPAVRDRFEYTFRYRPDQNDKAHELRGQLSLVDVAGAALVPRDVDVLAKALTEASGRIADVLGKQVGAIAHHLAAMHEPTGLSVSFSTLERAQEIFGGARAADVKWRGEWLSVDAFEEILGVDREIALKLHSLFRYRSLLNPTPRKQPLSSYPWMTPDLETLIRTRVRLPDWM